MPASSAVGGICPSRVRLRRSGARGGVSHECEFLTPLDPPLFLLDLAVPTFFARTQHLGRVRLKNEGDIRFTLDRTPTTMASSSRGSGARSSSSPPPPPPPPSSQRRRDHHPDHHHRRDEPPAISPGLLVASLIALAAVTVSAFNLTGEVNLTSKPWTLAPTPLTSYLNP